MKKLIKYVRDYSKNGQIVATIVATGAGKIGVAYVANSDSKTRRIKISDRQVNGSWVVKPLYQTIGFNRHNGIDLATSRAELGIVVDCPRKKISPYKTFPEDKFILSDVIRGSVQNMLDRSRKYFTV